MNIFGRRRDERRDAGQAGQQITDEQALEPYRYMLSTAPPEDIERAHEEAFARLTPDQRRQALQALAGVVPMFCLFELTNYFYAIMALFAVWAYGEARYSCALIGLSLAGTVVFLHLEWRALAYVANSGLVLAFLGYFLCCALLAARMSPAADPGYRPASPS